MNKIIVLLVASCLTMSVQAKKLEGSRPNIIYVMTDDQGSNLSYLGHPIVSTPNIDEFAEKAVRFNEFYVSPSCAPSRAALLSGRHEFRNGVTHTVMEREYMALSTTTFPQLLQRCGYTTGIFGKWHLGDKDAYLPGKRGFDEVLIHGAGGIGQKIGGSYADFPPNVARKKSCYFNSVLLHNDTVVQTTGYCCDIFFRAALGWIKQNLDAQKPFFAYISSNTPHSPLIAPQENYDRIKKRHPELNKVSGRFAMIENIDDNFGLLMKKLKEWGALENTLIVFTTDNGAPHKPGSKEWNAGYKTGKGTPREGGVHVPAFWSWQGVLPENKDVASLTAHIDVFKTMCELAGATIPDGIQPLDGRSLLPLLKDPDTRWNDRMLFHHRGRWDRNGAVAARDAGSVRTQDWRLVEEELYNIPNDPYEDHNVYSQHPEVVHNLKEGYLQWWKNTLPLMINENKSFEGVPPMEARYYKQKETIGILEWNPPEFK